MNKKAFIKSLVLLLFVLIYSCKTYLVNTKSESENIVLNESIEETGVNDYESIIKPYRNSLSASMSEVLNQSDVEMTTGIPEGNLGNFTADLTYEMATKYYEGEIDFALLNNGGLRTSLPKGDITRKKIFELMPFENQLVVVTLSFEKAQELFDFVATMSDTNLSVKKGVALSKHVNLVLQNKKTKEVKIGDHGLVQKEYKVVTSDYLASGGDKMNFFLNPIKLERVGIKLRDAILEYVVIEKEQGRSITAKADKRIRYAGR